MIVIAIDGDAAAGKGTLARRLAAELGFAYLDTGLLYRQTAYIILKNNKNIKSEADCHQAALQVVLGDLDESKLRNEAISQAASVVAAYPAVRQALLGIQHNFAQNPPDGKMGVVLDGRDIGTVVCPGATVKLYVTADPAIRAQRRAKELQDQGIAAIQAEVLADLKQRDDRDSGRKVAPLRIADDAYRLDTSGLDADRVFALALGHVKKILAK